MLEKDIEKRLTKGAEAKGYICLKFLSTVSGVPDCILFGYGHVFLAELKNGNKGRLSALQEYWLREFTTADIPVAVLRSYEDVEEFLSKLPVKRE